MTKMSRRVTRHVSDSIGGDYFRTRNNIAFPNLRGASTPFMLQRGRYELAAVASWRDGGSIQIERLGSAGSMSPTKLRLTADGRASAELSFGRYTLRATNADDADANLRHLRADGSAT